MMDRTLGAHWKPDRAKFAVHPHRNGVNLQVSVDPNFPNAWMKEPYYSELKRWAKDGAERGHFVFVRIGARLVVLLPDGERDVGQVGPDDDVVVSRTFTPAGFEYAVKVLAGREAAGSTGP
jgi:hypothetical protein